MMRSRKLPRSLPALVAGAALTLAAGPALAQDDGEFSAFRVLVEVNASDGDAGFQVFIDGDEWTEATIRGPGGKQVYKVKGFDGVREQGLTENFFESSEPSCDDDPLAAFLERFPAGEYVLSGKTKDNAQIERATMFTHDIPRAPINLAPMGGGVDPSSPVAVLWTPGVDLGNCPPNGAAIGNPAIFGYEVIVVRADPTPEAVMNVDMPASASQMTIPAEFLQAGAIYKYEVIAIESRLNEDLEAEKGNQTLSEGFFCTFVPTPGNPCEVPE